MYNQELQNGGYSDQNIRENLEIALDTEPGQIKYWSQVTAEPKQIKTQTLTS